MSMITSSANERLKRLRKLRKRRARDDEGVFVVEGYRQVKRAVEGGVEVTELFVCPELFQGENEAAVIAAASAPVTEVAPKAFGDIATRDRPDGLLAVARQFDTSLDRQHPTDSGALILVAEGVERPGNLGTMLRAASAAGVTGFIAADPQTDVFAPEVVRASVGALFLQPVSVASAADAAAWLKGHGLQIVTASPDAHLTYWDVDLTMRTAVVVGSEQHGVTPLWFDAADAAVRIPMVGPVDSLNVAVAASVVLFDAVRQRRQPRSTPR